MKILHSLFECNVLLNLLLAILAMEMHIEANLLHFSLLLRLLLDSSLNRS